MVGLAKRPRARLPRQVPPFAIEREYAKALLSLLRPMHESLALFLADLPDILASAARERNLTDRADQGGDQDSQGVNHPDREDAGEGKRIRELLAQASARMAQSITPELVAQVAEKFARRTATYQRIQLGRQVRAALGADPFIADRGLEAMVDDFAQANAALITSIPRQLADRIAQASSRAVQRATPHPELAKTITKELGMAKNRAKLIARDQVGKLYGQVNAARQRELGAEKFEWSTVHDERVRPEHVALDGKVFSYAKPPAEGLPGEPILCRCYASPVFDFK